MIGVFWKDIALLGILRVPDKKELSYLLDSLKNLFKYIISWTS